MTSQLIAADFSSLVGDVLPVRVNTAEGVVEVALTVTRVDERTAAAAELPDPFTVDLSGPANAVLPQGTFAFVHPSHGPVDLFIVPHSAGPDGAVYSITFG